MTYHSTHAVFIPTRACISKCFIYLNLSCTPKVNFNSEQDAAFGVAFARDLGPESAWWSYVGRIDAPALIGWNFQLSANKTKNDLVPVRVKLPVEAASQPTQSNVPGYTTLQQEGNLSSTLYALADNLHSMEKQARVVDSNGL
uniref:Uncharacterized protein n=1 Tax=Moniliophthora roreri TaxID=221103 RepID=A0A0W0F422_MONRR